MKRPGASTVATASVDADSDAAGVAASDISGAADSDAEADGVAAGAASSLFDAGREITITASSAIPTIAAINKRGEVPCLGAALGLAAAALTGVGVVATFTRDELDPPSGTGGITILLADVDFFAADFLATFLRAGAFLATFLATAFFLAGAFLATAFLRAGAFLVIFLAAAFFFAGAFFAVFFTTFLTTFLAAVFFLTGAFFFTATVKLLKD